MELKKISNDTKQTQHTLTNLTTPGRTMPSIGFGLYQLSREATQRVTTRAVERGWRHFDGARVYRNERELGETIANLPHNHRREDLFLTSKLDKAGTSTSALADVRKSIRYHKTTYLDLMLIHSATPGYLNRIEAWKQLCEAYNTGLCRSIGVSNYGIKHLEELRKVCEENEGVVMPHVNQIQLHPWLQNRDIVAYCKSHGIVVQAFSPLARASRWQDPTIDSLAKKHGVTAAQVLIKWSLTHGFVPLVKTENEDRLSENLLSNVHFNLDQEDMAAIDALDDPNGACTWNPVNCD
ncbi:hypothetical protein E3P81_00247 [Wallemia ichthyophaga]|nr:hypothetical protein E3P91_01605 [Wallemia ichthyophaga]TIA94224.1 hypothetical protein E3P97_00249 [Wallemia ichthyophaga]TIA98830.1 hypothetical protein E3P96_03048 [Wallemia ichthyophaga]TIB50969.1 hypothetical protein E3P82_00249 [Wallemia ichthyophaga]TIB54470.1 hypothetical protein E3P81_00247 [Wallemia ichthyophaga]